MKSQTSSTNKKRHLKLVQNASDRSDTVFAREVELNTIHSIPTEPRVLKHHDVTHIIRLEGETRGLKVENPRVVCTCGELHIELDEENKTLTYLGRMAKKHAEETGHVLRGRENG